MDYIYIYILYGFIEFYRASENDKAWVPLSTLDTTAAISSFALCLFEWLSGELFLLWNQIFTFK